MNKQISDNHHSAFAPIIVFAFNRLEPLKNTIASLQFNAEAKESDLYIFIDGARDNKPEEKEKVQQVSKYASTISGFRSISITASEKNKGLGPSIISGVSEVFKTSKKVIVLEDDLVVAKGFLCFMNTMLDAYENDQRIMQVTGFSTKHYIPKDYQYDIYLNRRGESWSWGTWIDRWHDIDWEVKDYKSLLNDRKKQRAFNEIGSDLFGMLKGYMEGRNKSWAVRFCYSMFKQGSYTVAPILSLVKNEGFNADATNCKTKYNLYTYEFNNRQTSFSPKLGIAYDYKIDKSANRYWSIRYRIWGKIVSTFYNLFS